MLKRMPTRLLLVAMVLGLSACATVPQPTAWPTFEPVYHENTFKVALGSLIDVPAVDEKNPGEARVVEEYHAASGRHCLKVEMLGEDVGNRIMCQRDNGQWSFTRSLFTTVAPRSQEELLIQTPLNEKVTKRVAPVEVAPVEVATDDVIEHPSVAEVFGTQFRNLLTTFKSFDGKSAWNYAGTITAGPAKWVELAEANNATTIVKYVIENSSVAESFGTDFTPTLTTLNSFDGQSAWNYAGTITAGPAKWLELAVASNSFMMANADGFITGRR